MTRLGSLVVSVAKRPDARADTPEHVYMAILILKNAEGPACSLKVCPSISAPRQAEGVTASLAHVNLLQATNATIRVLQGGCV
jgi:hypothetical protein